MCEGKSALKEQAKEVKDSDIIKSLASKIEFGYINIVVQDKKVMQVEIKYKFR